MNGPNHKGAVLSPTSASVSSASVQLLGPHKTGLIETSYPQATAECKTRLFDCSIVQAAVSFKHWIIQLAFQPSERSRHEMTDINFRSD